MRYHFSGYDGGDCCECTCVSTDDYTCGDNGGFSCLDPSAPCVNDDDVTSLPSSERFCINEFIGDGDCDEGNNYSECGKLPLQANKLFWLSRKPSSFISILNGGSYRLVHEN